ncbi:hypothetical protein O181_052616 [Austropuccinia psidii MF-1]|uniref:Retrovirus-related Pol polyprotein from transposon TNT 1-94-like beta-barrel domain-containing protein n=1 Tax=Austropuccinia psidii MF-1 TaxID=1389203 RepID=A0A9Q3E5Y2_9BASI|nr:hypothetical protein [Austropuccinia psidii MF-1]
MESITPTQPWPPQRTKNKTITTSKIKKRRQDGDYPKCSPGWHNSLTKHDESECNFLKLDKNKNLKPIQSLVLSTTETSMNQKILNSGATTSMFNNPSLFTNFTPRTQTIKLGDRSTIHAAGTGTIKLGLHHFFLELKNFLLIKYLDYNLISLGAIMKPKFKIITKEKETFNLLDHNNELILHGTYNTGNFELTINQHKALAIKITDQIRKTLHQLTGDPSLEYLKKMFPSHNFDNLICNTCSLAKITKNLFKGHFPIPKQKLQFLHGELSGPIKTPSNSGYKYFLRVMDSYRRYSGVVFLRAKSDVEFQLQKLIIQIEFKVIQESQNLYQIMVLNLKTKN